MSLNSLKKYEYIEIELKNGEIYKGNLSFFDERLLEMWNIEFDGKPQDICLTFYRTEIRNLKRLSQPGTNPEQTDNDDENSSQTEEELLAELLTINVVNYAKASDNAKDMEIEPKLNEIEFGRFTKMIDTYVYIGKFGEEFNRSIAQLSRCQCVGVVGLGFKENVKVLSFLAFSSINEIFIYDLLQLQSLDSLKVIFESPFIRKIVHNGKQLYSHLRHNYNTKINNLFDTQIADSVISKRDEAKSVTRSLPACLAHRYRIPKLFYDKSVQYTDWWDRPLPRNDKRLIGYLVVFLRKLYNDLERLLLKDLHQRTHSEYEAYSSQSDVDLVFRNARIVKTRPNRPPNP